MLEEHLDSLGGSLPLEGNGDILGNSDRLKRELARLLTKTVVKYGKDLNGVGEVVLAGSTNQFDVAPGRKNRSVRQEIPLVTEERYGQIEELIRDSSNVWL